MKNPKYEKVEHNVMLEGHDGERQIDVLITSISFGIKFNTIIECRDYKKKLSVSSIDGFHSKILDVKANKGILISRKGFSSMAISKAKRLGITLCTADEIENENWESIIDLPILLEEVKLTDFNVNVNHDPSFKYRIDGKFLEDINGYNLIELFKRKWKNDEFNLEGKVGVQKIDFNEIKPPFYGRTTDGEKFELTKFKVSAYVIVKNYRTSTRNLVGTQILDNLTEGKKSIFIAVNSILKLDYNLFKLSTHEIPRLADFACRVRIFPNFEFDIGDVKVRHNK